MLGVEDSRPIRRGRAGPLPVSACPDAGPTPPVFPQRGGAVFRPLLLLDHPLCLVHRPERKPQTGEADPSPAGRPSKPGGGHVEFLRGLCEPGKPLPAAGQCPVCPGAPGGAAHQPHQHRHVPALRLGGPGSGAHRFQGPGPAGGEDNRFGGEAGKMAGEPVQLVRHQLPHGAAAPLCLGGGQRQPGLLPCSAQRGAQGVPGGGTGPHRPDPAGGGAGGWDRSIPLLQQKEEPLLHRVRQRNGGAQCLLLRLLDERSADDELLCPQHGSGPPPPLGGDEPLHEPQRFLCRTPLLDRHHV